MKQIRRIAVLGTENSHALAFANLIRTCPELTLVGAFGAEPAANERFSSTFGVPCVTDPAAFAGRVDGVMVTARNGSAHLELAHPYLTPGTVLFVDKPLCGTAADAEELLRLVGESGALLSGGSCLQYAPSLLRLRDRVDAARADVIGASFSAPVEMESPYGGFLFYAPHLVQMCLTVLGNGIRAVRAIRQGDHVTALLRYDTFCASLFFGCDTYSATVSFRTNTYAGTVRNIPGLYTKEFAVFRAQLNGTRRAVPAGLSDHVRVACAIEESYRTGTDVPLHTIS